MNQRIKELAEQAGLYHRINDNNFYPTALSAEQSSPAYQKFAELIVRECVDIADEYDGAGSTIVSRIKKHFGVEE